MRRFQRVSEWIYARLLGDMALVLLGGVCGGVIGAVASGWTGALPGTLIGAVVVFCLTLGRA